MPSLGAPACGNCQDHKLATVYCKNDRFYFCDSCDREIHDSSRFLKSH
jgi:hypothetical protein